MLFVCYKNDEMDQKTDKILEEINSLKAKIRGVREIMEPIDEKVSYCEEKQDILEDKVEIMQSQLAWLEQYGMNNDVIISGIIEEKGKELNEGDKLERNRITRNG